MSFHLNSIERLSEETRSRLRSTQILTSLPQIVSELLQNSLDANASHIDVGVNYKEWMCWVQDNGIGISKDGLEKLGAENEAGRYNTSKMYAPEFTNSVSTFGFRGEALASAANVSCLEICSRTAKSRNTWSLIMKGSKQLYLDLAVRWNKESPGTTVCVRDAFYNLPVRRHSHPNSTRTWELVRQDVETHALMFPHVTFTVEDMSRQGEPSHRSIRIAKCISTLDSFRHLFGRALTEHIDEIDFNQDSVKIDGFISLTGASSKAYQFLYVNRHPIYISDFGRVIDLEFASSSFASNALDEEGKDGSTRSVIRRSPRKNQKKPVYVLNISIAPEEVDNCLEPSKGSVQLRNRISVIACLTTVIRTFLDKNGFLCRNRDSLGRSTVLSSSPRKRRKSDYNLVDDSGYAEEDSIVGISALSFRDQKKKTAGPSGELYASMDDPGEKIVWQDAATGEQFVVDPRTGHSFRQIEYHTQSEDVDASMIDINQGKGRRTLRQQHSGSMAAVVPAWLENALQKNDAYPTAESGIRSAESHPTVGRSVSGRKQIQKGEEVCHRPQDPTHFERFRQCAFDPGYDLSNHEFTKEDLRHVEVIEQVDRKFIACRITKPVSRYSKNPLEDPSLSEGILVLVDQHAADERIRVERLLKELCMGFLGTTPGVEVRELIPPRPVLLTQHEFLSIMGSQDILNSLRIWGVQVVLPGKNSESGQTSDPGSSGYVQIHVKTVPEIVGEKFLQGDELRDFIKGFLGQIQSGELFTDSGLDLLSADRGEFAWLKAVRHCPKGLLELINSKACRGAVMFNDSLSVKQCERLIQQLSETAFPFQCAHGRPSIVPLIKTSALSSNSYMRKISQSNWARLMTIEGTQRPN